MERSEPARAPSGEDPSPPLEGWLPDIPKSGWEGRALNAGPGYEDYDTSDCGGNDPGDGGNLATGQTMRVQVSARSWRETRTSTTWGLDGVMAWRIARRRGT